MTDPTDSAALPKPSKPSGPSAADVAREEREAEEIDRQAEEASRRAFLERDARSAAAELSGNAAEASGLPRKKNVCDFEVDGVACGVAFDRHLSHGVLLAQRCGGNALDYVRGGSPLREARTA